VGELVELVYVSTAKNLLHDRELVDILESSRLNNARDDIGGMLVYHDGSFLQILEGPPEAVDAAYTRIKGDPRHSNIIPLLRKKVDQRSFPEWSMGFAHPSRHDLMEIPGCNDFFAEGHCLSEVNEGQAKKLLEGFRNRSR
jgi:hypothetical protein